MTKNFTLEKPSIKFVHRANCWCVTYAKDGEQKQEWFDTETQAKAFAAKL